MEDSDSAIMPSDSADGDVTLGSPGLRRAFRDEEEDSEDDVAQTQASNVAAVRSRRNKRKNFRPRNIVYNATEGESETGNGNNNNNEDEDEEEDDSGSSGLPLNLSAGSGIDLAAGLAGLRKTLMPRKSEAASSPIDLSVPSSHFQRFGDTDKRAGNLSVVRPEILFGAGSRFNPPGLLGDMLPQIPMPPMQFGPSLAALAAAASASERQAAAVSMKEAFQEVLKLYGVPLELAEAIAKNANNCTPGRRSYLFPF
jgi:hypothetical protein